jgi:hypothetical protein
MRWTLNLFNLSSEATRSIKSVGVKASIVVIGAVIAAGSIHRATYLPHAPLVERMTAAAPVNVKTPWGTTITPDSTIAPGGLDAGVDHDLILGWVKRLSGSMKFDFARTLERKAKYETMIAAKLDAKNMPRDLIYLAMIESEFNPNAKSPVKAVGMWQFMSATARQFGLTVKGRVDERRDPARATDAAVQYLSDLHKRLGSWYLAAAAYNSGEGTVIKALKATTGKVTGTDEDFFRILPLLPKETRDYVPKLIAAARVGNSPQKYGLPPRDSAAASAPAPAASTATPSAPVTTPTVTATSATASKKAGSKKAGSTASASKKKAVKKAVKKPVVTKKKASAKARTKKTTKK